MILVCPFVLFLLAIILSTLLRFTAADYPIGIFKHLFGNTLTLTSNSLWHWVNARFNKHLISIRLCDPLSHSISTHVLTAWFVKPYPIQTVRRVWRFQRVIRIRISKKNREHNGKKYKRTNNDLQNSTNALPTWRETLIF